MFEKILVCLDGSKNAEQILPYVIQACRTATSEITLLQVITSEITIPPLQTMHIPPFVRKTERKPAQPSDMVDGPTVEADVNVQMSEIAREEFEAKRYLERAAKTLRDAGLQVRTTALQGYIAETIIRYAKKHQITAIALTTHGAGRVEHDIILGEVAQGILREWHGPLLIVKPRESRAQARDESV